MTQGLGAGSLETSLQTWHTSALMVCYFGQKYRVFLYFVAPVLESAAVSIITLLFSFSGVFPFNFQNLALRAISKQRINSGFLHPGKPKMLQSNMDADVCTNSHCLYQFYIAGFRMSCKILLRQNLEALIARADYTIGQHFEGDDIPDTDDYKRAKVQIVGISLSYQSCIVNDPKVLAAIMATRMQASSPTNFQEDIV